MHGISDVLVSSSAFYPYGGPSTCATKYRLMRMQFLELIVDSITSVDNNVENLQGQWREIFVDSNEDKDTENPNLTGDDFVMTLFSIMINLF
ncbi:hypothetical protein V6N13_018695 [Hibiscus sabdariffa]